MEKIKVKSANSTRFGRLEPQFTDIMMESVRAVLAEADVARIRDIYLAAYAPGPLCGLTDPLRTMSQAIQGAFPALRATCHGVYKTGGHALFDALQDFPGRDDVLVVGCEKMTHLDPAVAAGHLGGIENAHDRAYGATLPALGGIVTGAYLTHHRIPEEALHDVSIKNHDNAAANPRAHFQRKISREDVAASPLIADPLRRLHCAPLSDGAAAVLLSRDGGDIVISGWGHGEDSALFQDRGDITRFAATHGAAVAAMAMAGVAHDDVNVIEIHDAFASFELINLEAMGFYGHGRAYHALQDGELNLAGRHAVNTSGGKKAYGHPIGASGVSSLVEIGEQLSGRAGARQQPGAAVAMIQSVGGIAKDSYVFVMESV